MLFCLSAFEGDLGIFFDVEEVGGFEVPVALFVVGVDAGHLDCGVN